jgi:hypothetical protein
MQPKRVGKSNQLTNGTAVSWMTGNPEVEIDTNLSLLAYGMLDERREFRPISQYNGVNRSPLRPGGSLVYILVPWKPVVIVWALLSGMILAGFIGSSLLQGKDPFARPCERNRECGGNKRKAWMPIPLGVMGIIAPRWVRFGDIFLCTHRGPPFLLEFIWWS